MVLTIAKSFKLMPGDRVVLSESCEPGSYARGPRYEGVVAEVRLVRWYLVRQHIQGTNKIFCMQGEIVFNIPCHEQD